MPPTWESLFRQAVAGVIESGAAVRANSAEIWAEVKGAAREAGLPIGQQGFALVTDLWSKAVARRNGYQRFQRADPAALFTRDMAAPDMNVRAAELRDMMPMYLARFDLTYTGRDGSQETRTVSMRDVWQPGMTVGDVMDAVAEAAEGLASDYGTGLVGFGNVRPVSI